MDVADDSGELFTIKAKATTPFRSSKHTENRASWPERLHGVF
jgi:hypothetical protein